MASAIALTLVYAARPFRANLPRREMRNRKFAGGTRIEPLPRSLVNQNPRSSAVSDKNPSL